MNSRGQSAGIIGIPQQYAVPAVVDTIIAVVYNSIFREEKL